MKEKKEEIYKIEYWASTDIVGSKKSDIIEVEKEEWDSVGEREKDEYI